MIMMTMITNTAFHRVRHTMGLFITLPNVHAMGEGWARTHVTP